MTQTLTLWFQDGAVIITQECGTYIQCENNNFVEYTSNCDANATCEVTNDVFSCECPINMADINGDGSECRGKFVKKIFVTKMAGMFQKWTVISWLIVKCDRCTPKVFENERYSSCTQQQWRFIIHVSQTTQMVK